MPFVKLDCNIINSTLWFEKTCRDVFLTSLLMAVPYETDRELEQIKVRTLEKTGFKVPPGKYGMVESAGVGILHKAMIEDTESGFLALEALGEPEEASRSQDYDGRRLVRVDGGYIVLNYWKYREKDYTAAERQRRHREKKAASHTVTSLRNAVTSRRVTYADADADADKKKKRGSNGKPSRPQSLNGLTDSEFLERLSNDQTYTGLDVKRIHGKMCAWCKVNQKTPTRRRFINWLNREEKPMRAQNVYPKTWSDRQIKEYEQDRSKGT